MIEKGGRVVVCEGGKKKGLVSWQVEQGGRVVSWGGRKRGRIVRWQGL